MTSRERLLASIAHREPDRVPVDLGATPSSGISAIAYARLKKHLGMRGGATRVYDVVQQLAQPEEEILDRYRIDVVDVGRTFDTADTDWYDVTLFDGSAAQYPRWFRPQALPGGGWHALAPDGMEIATQLKDMNFFDQTCFPWMDGCPSDLREALPRAMSRVHWAALAHSPWDHAGEADFWETLRANALALREAAWDGVGPELWCGQDVLLAPPRFHARPCRLRGGAAAAHGSLNTTGPTGPNRHTSLRSAG
jgi:uroporphyrinogen decarboxylase